MKISKQLGNWLASQNLTIYQLLSIAFVPRRTYFAIVKDNERRLAEMQRLHTVTSLPEFAITSDEEKQINNNWTSLNETDKLIMEYFLKIFQEGKILDLKFEDQLITGNHFSKDKKELTKNLLKNYFGKKDFNHQLTQGKHNQFTKQPPSSLPVFLKEVETLFESGNEDKIKNFISSNRENLRNALEFFNILMSPEPMKTYKQVFTNKKTN